MEGKPSEELVAASDYIDAEIVPYEGGTLFRTDDPVEIIARATDVAKALSEVLKKQGLTTVIGGKHHVRVEGWTLCGSMLGVYPVVVWTRKLENGWEARVEAKTRDGAVVGAAEAECLTNERRWKTADDYAVRSMAQTRAVSKALRAPLGFIVALAGFETTPAEEMPKEEAQPAREFDVELDLMEGAIHGKDAPKQLVAALKQIEPTVDWAAVIESAIVGKYGKPSRAELTPDETQDFWRRLSNAVRWIERSSNGMQGDFPPVPEELIVAGFAYAFTGTAVEIIYETVDTPAVIVDEKDDVSFEPPGDVDIGSGNPYE